MPDMVGDGRDEQQQAQRAPERYNTLTISSVRNLGYEALDFGGGVPSRMMWKTAEQPVGLVCVVCSPCKPKDMINVMSLCVKPEHAEAFLHELAALNIEANHDLRLSPKARL
jgi:hypothetical protein